MKRVLRNLFRFKKIEEKNVPPEKKEKKVGRRGGAAGREAEAQPVSFSSPHKARRMEVQANWFANNEKGRKHLLWVFLERRIQKVGMNYVP